MLIQTFPVGPLQCNCSIIVDEQTGEAVIIDPGDEAQKIIDQVKKEGFTVKYLLHTHAHFDHIGGTAPLKQTTQAKIGLHRDDLYLYDNLAQQGALFGLSIREEVKPVDCFLIQGDVVEWGNSSRLEILHTPGHTPGSLTFLSRDVGGRECLFTGDTLFMGSIGRTDLWGGDFGQIIDSIKNKILPLPDDTLVLPGHGPQTNIGQERKMNPFLVNV